MNSAQTDIEDIKAYCERLRLDLASTNAALFAVFAAIPSVYRDRALQRLAAHSVQRAELVAEQQDPAQEAALARLEAAEERLYRELQRISAQQQADGV